LLFSLLARRGRQRLKEAKFRQGPPENTGCYGHIKEANVARYRQECVRLERAIGQPVAQATE
jgi:hypothetical protein